MDHVLVSRRSQRAIRIWVARGPKHDKAVRAVQQLGGEAVTASAEDCSYALVDKDGPNLYQVWKDLMKENNAISILDTTWIFDCLRSGKRLDRMQYEVVAPSSPARRATRIEYTPQDERHLIRFLTRHAEMPRMGNAVHMKLAKRHDRHTWQSWKERYKQNQRKYDVEIEAYKKLVAERRWRQESPYSASEDDQKTTKNKRGIPSTQSSSRTTRPALQTANATDLTVYDSRVEGSGTKHQPAEASQSAPSTSNKDRDNTRSITKVSQRPQEFPEAIAGSSHTAGASKAMESQSNGDSQPHPRSQWAPSRKRKRPSDFIDDTEEEREHEEEQAAASTSNQAETRRPPADIVNVNGNDAHASTSGGSRSLQYEEIVTESTVNPRTQQELVDAAAASAGRQHKRKPLTSRPLPASLTEDNWTGDNLFTRLTAQQVADLVFVCSGSRDTARELAVLLSKEDEETDKLEEDERKRFKDLSKQMWTPEEDDLVRSGRLDDRGLVKRHSDEAIKRRRVFLQASRVDEGRRRFPFDM